MTIRAVAVGINQYRNYPQENLQMCVADERTMQTVFEKFLGVDPANLIYLLDDAATTGNELSALEQVVKASQPGDKLFWSRSGHGCTYTTPDGVTHEALCGSNIAEKGNDWDFSTLITGPQAGAILAGMPAGSLVEAFWDCCFSGLAWRGVFSRTSRKYIEKFLPHPMTLKGNFSPTADRKLIQDIPVEMVLWAACAGNQEAADAPALGNGAFTWAWAKAFAANPGLSRDDLITQIRTLLRQQGFPQVPQLDCGAAEGAGKVGAL